jgi:hypothetical protein
VPELPHEITRASARLDEQRRVAPSERVVRHTLDGWPSLPLQGDVRAGDRGGEDLPGGAIGGGVASDSLALAQVDVLEREQAALSLLQRGAITEPDERWQLFALVVSPYLFASVDEGEWR